MCGGCARACARACAKAGIPDHAQTERFNIPIIPLARVCGCVGGCLGGCGWVWVGVGGCGWVWVGGCVCVYVCVPRDQFHSCSNCEVQNSYILPLLQTISSVFGPAGGQPQRALDLHMYRVLPTHRSSSPVTPKHTVHAVCPTSPHRPAPCIPVEVGGGGGGATPSWQQNPVAEYSPTGLNRTDMSLLSYLPCWPLVEPPSSQPWRGRKETNNRKRTGREDTENCNRHRTPAKTRDGLATLG